MEVRFSVNVKVLKKQFDFIVNFFTGSAAKEPIDLSTAITPETMVPILANKDVQKRLIPHLPEGSSLPKNEEELRNTIATPQFQQVSDRAV